MPAWGGRPGCGPSARSSSHCAPSRSPRALETPPARENRQSGSLHTPLTAGLSAPFRPTPVSTFFLLPSVCLSPLCISWSSSECLSPSFSFCPISLGASVSCLPHLPSLFPLSSSPLSFLGLRVTLQIFHSVFLSRGPHCLLSLGLSLPTSAVFSRSLLSLSLSPYPSLGFFGSLCDFLSLSSTLTCSVFLCAPFTAFISLSLSLPLFLCCLSKHLFLCPSLCLSASVFLCACP